MEGFFLAYFNNEIVNVLRSHDSYDSIKKWSDVYHPLFERYDVDLVVSEHAGTCSQLSIKEYIHYFITI
jgi:hypothetical protein